MSVEITKQEDVIITETEGVEVLLKSPEDITSKAVYNVEAAIKKWTILGDEIYIANQTDTIPLWYQGVLDSYITNSSTLANTLGDLSTNFSNFQLGYDNTITTINDNHSSLVANVETNYVQNSTYSAGIQNLEITKVDGDGAAAIAAATIGAWENDASGGGAWFDEKVSLIAETQGVHADSINSLNLQYNGISVSIDTLESITATGTGWVANASKLITAPDGSITGWEFADGTNQKGEFKIFADKFTISDGVNPSLIPFKVENNEVIFGHIVKSDDFIPFTQGFRLKANATGTTTDPTIYGAYIKGATLEAANILSQDIIEVKSLNNSDLLVGGGSFDILSYTFMLDDLNTRKAIIDFTSNYEVDFINWSTDTYSQRHHFEILLDDQIIYKTEPMQVKVLISEGNPNIMGWYKNPDFPDLYVVVEMFPKLLPENYKVEMELSSGYHTVKARVVLDRVDDNVYTYK